MTLALVCALFVFPDLVSYAAPHEITGEDKFKVFEQLKKLQEGIDAIGASVIQEKRTAALKRNMRIEGTMVLAKSGLLRWDIAKPERSVTVIDSERMTVYHPDAKEAQVYALSDHMIARTTSGFFSAALTGNLKEMEKRFSVTVFRKDEELILKLVPLSGMVSRYLSTVYIHYDEATGVPKAFRLTTPKGDETVTNLTNIRVNPTLGPDTFTVRLPKDVWITNKPDQN